MSDKFFDIHPSAETTRHFEVIASMSPRYIHATRNTLYRMGKIIYTDAKGATKRGVRTGELFKYGRRRLNASAPGEAPQLRSGFLRKSLGFNVVGMTVLHVRDDAPYAGFLEDGTKKMKPRPFLRPAIDSWSPFFPVIGQQEMAKAMGAA